MYQKHYAQCPKCTRVFIESDFSRSRCGYDQSLLINIGLEYPTTPVKVGA